MTSPRRPLLAAPTVVATLVAAATLVGCGAGEPDRAADTSPGAPTRGTSSGSPAPLSTSPEPPAESPRPTRESPQEQQQMTITIGVGGETFDATLDDSAASRDLLAQLPVTIEMTDHEGVEKTGRLPAPLSTDGQPDAGDPAVGDLGYYAPGQDLVLYHGDQSAYPGIVVLGRLDGDAAERLAAMPGSVTVTVTDA